MFNKIYDGLKKFIRENWFVLVLLVFLFICLFGRVPYEVNMPGGIIDLDNRVTVNGEAVDIAGSFNMAYVSVAQGSIPNVLLGLILPDWEVEKISETTYENETIEDANKRSKLYLEQSKNYATVVAMDAAGIAYEVSNKINYVAYIDSRAKTDLKVGDNILFCEGKEVADINDITKIVQETNVSDTVSFVVERDGKKVETSAVVYEEENKHYVGISSITTFAIHSDTFVDISSRESESGPSGGLMMTLMVYNALTNQDLTHNKKIVGTGTISLDGGVGEIGGVKYKLMGAVKNEADVFLVPEGNYDEAMEVKKKKGYTIDIVKVSTLNDAITYLEGLS